MLVYDPPLVLYVGVPDEPARPSDWARMRRVVVFCGPGAPYPKPLPAGRWLGVAPWLVQASCLVCRPPLYRCRRHR